MVNTSTNVTDIAGATGKPAPNYVGKGGVGMSSGARRLAFAWRYRDLDLAISKSITSSSRLLTNRAVTRRVHAVAPFLHLDSDPYAVVHNGQVVWIVEAYVASASYPNADRSSRFAINPSKSAGSQPNSYVRNSIRVTVDAYSGKVRLFRTQMDEPIARTYANAYPRLFDSVAIGTRFPGIEENLRYPSDLFNLRASLWGRFHVEEADKFYDESDRWSIGASDSRVLSEPTAGRITVDQLTPPEYVVADPLLSGTQGFFIQQALIAKGRRAEAAADQRLRSLVLASSTPKKYGRLLSLNVPSDYPYDSPASAGKRFSSDPRISKEETDLGRGGSEVVNGQVQIVRLKESLLYVRPFYVRAEDQNKSRPRLSFVEVQYGNKIGFASTLAGALDQVRGDEKPVRQIRILPDRRALQNRSDRCRPFQRHSPPTPRSAKFLLALNPFWPTPTLP